MGRDRSRIHRIYVAANIRRLRVKAQLTQEKLAEAGKDFPGSGEDIADQLATYLMWSVKIEEVSVVGGLVFFEIDEADKEVDLWDEHTPTKKRLANLACWSYGASPEDTKDLLLAVGERLGNSTGMARRAERCGSEWARIKKVGDQAVKFKRSDPEMDLH